MTMKLTPESLILQFATTLAAMQRSTNVSSLPQRPSSTSSTAAATSTVAAAPITITLDSTTQIIGHCNVLTLGGATTTTTTTTPTVTTAGPSSAPTIANDAARLAALVAVALRHVSGASDRPINIKIQSGVRVLGNRNTVALMGGTQARMAGVARSGVQAQVGQKRKAEEDLNDGSFLKKRSE